PRATVDPDDLSGGFGIWSGTSFAAPVLAGELAAHLAADPDIGKPDLASALERGWRALEEELPWTRP
ncbi:MAG TPA: hypothetical protein VHM65_05670, partial [Candidatus Lustribacter sp.]|nr:hypothetical protein [Candidatus Lustribacter sp.]